MCKAMALLSLLCVPYCDKYQIDKEVGSFGLTHRDMCILYAFFVYLVLLKYEGIILIKTITPVTVLSIYLT